MDTLRRALTGLGAIAALALLPVTPGLAQDTAAPTDPAAVGRRIAAAVNEQDVDRLMEILDFDALGGSLGRDVGLSASDTKRFQEGLRRGARETLEATIRRMAKDKGNARFVRAGTRDGKPTALVRFDFGEDSGYDYVEYYLSPARKVEDWYSYGRASRARTAMGVLLAALLKKDSILKTVLGIERVDQAGLKTLVEFGTHVAAGELAKADRALDQLPESYRKTRDWAILKAGVASHDERAHRAALEHLARNFGNDSDLQLVLVDHYFYQQRFDLALKAIAAFERTIGGEDAATSFLRCSVLTEWKRHADALKACKRAIDLEPDFKSAYFGVVTVGLESKNPTLALSGLSAYEKAFDMAFDPDELAKIEGYQELARTPEFAAWAKVRRGAK